MKTSPKPAEQNIRGNSPVSDELAATSVCYEAIKRLPPRSQDVVLDWLRLRLTRERQG